MDIHKVREQKRRTYHKHKTKYLEQKRKKWILDPVFRKSRQDYLKKWKVENPEKYAKQKERQKNKGLRIRFELLSKYDFTCQYCGRKAPLVILEIDHIIPVSKGGKDTKENLTIACKDCNEGKSNTLLKS